MWLTQLTYGQIPVAITIEEIQNERKSSKVYSSSDANRFSEATRSQVTSGALAYVLQALAQRARLSDVARARLLYGAPLL